MVSEKNRIRLIRAASWVIGLLANLLGLYMLWNIIFADTPLLFIILAAWLLSTGWIISTEYWQWENQRR